MKFFKLYLSIIVLTGICFSACGADDPATTITNDSDTNDSDTNDSDTNDSDTNDSDTNDSDTNDTLETIIWDPTSISENEEIFPIFVQAGMMRATSALIWTYANEENFAMRLRIWPEESRAELTSDLLTIDLDVQSGDDGYTHISVENLEPNTRYEYGFFVENEEVFVARSRISRFQTALPEGSTTPITIGATHGTNFNYAPYEALSLTAEEDIDFFLHLGDLAYNDSAETLSEYRENWFRTLQDPGYQDILRSTGFYMTWDDHELWNNYDPETGNEARILTGKRSFWETFPIVQGEQGQLWNKYRWGNTLELIVLDCRSERIPSTRGDEDIYISQEQMDWLKDSLLNSTAHFKVIVTSVPITNMPFWYVSASDRWEGYEHQRDELLGYIHALEIQNVWFLGGDFHIGMISRLDPDGPNAGLFEISPGPGGNIGVGSTLGAATTPEGQFLFHTTSTQPEVATTITFNPELDAVHVRFINATNDEVLYDDWLSQE